LWQNRFFSTIIEAEPYLWAVVRYIEQNPVKSKLVGKPEDYKWSSCRANISGKGDLLVSDEWLGGKERAAYRKFLMQRDPEVEQKIRRATSTGRPLGSHRFVEKLELKLLRRLSPGKPGRPQKPKGL
jgi:putative transposase